jgi:predicted protein tyrosine phosphatase
VKKISLIVLSREEALAFVPHEPTAYISIYTPGDAPPEFKDLPNIRGTLKIAFDDLGSERCREARFESGRACSLITDAQAEEILRFVQESIARGIAGFMIHCNAGISRSPGVAAALDLCVNGNRALKPRYVMMNKLVYKKVVEAFKGPVVGADELPPFPAPRLLDS